MLAEPAGIITPTARDFGMGLTAMKVNRSLKVRDACAITSLFP
jgi:hypothetical protein